MGKKGEMFNKGYGEGEEEKGETTYATGVPGGKGKEKSNINYGEEP